MVSVRTVLVGLALAFTAYLAARGLWWTEPIDQPTLVIGSLALYLAGTWMCLFMEPRPYPRRPKADGEPRPPVSRLPMPATLVTMLVALVVPSGIALGVGPAARTEAFATWYIGGVGVLMAVVMIRRRPWFAWAGMALLAAACHVWMGLVVALALGLVGSLMWVTAAQLLIISLDRATADTIRLAELQQAASAWQASQAGRQRERRIQVQRALAIAGPVLTRVVRSAGHLDQEGRAAAHLAEGLLRDELRGARLLDDEVRAALEAARRSGVAVTVLDEGGLDGVDAASLATIRAELAQTIRAARSRRLYIRTAPHDTVAVTIVGRQEADGALSDDDSVDLWREIPFPGRSGA